MSKKIGLKETGAKNCFERQSRAKYMGETLVFMYRKRERETERDRDIIVFLILRTI